MSNFDSFSFNLLNNREIEWFNGLFTRLKRLTCLHTGYLKHIPVNMLFNKKFDTNDEIDELHIVFTVETEDDLINFLNRYNEYFKNECESNNGIIRGINKLTIDDNSASSSFFHLWHILSVTVKLILKTTN